MKVKIISWNVWGLNDNKKETIKSLVKKWKPDVLCLQETKIEEWSTVIATHIWGSRWIDWVELKSYGRSGGITIFWDKRQWSRIDFLRGTYSITAMFEGLQGDIRWCFTGVYGPSSNWERTDFWDELADIRGLD